MNNPPQRSQDKRLLHGIRGIYVGYLSTLKETNQTPQVISMPNYTPTMPRVLGEPGMGQDAVILDLVLAYFYCYATTKKFVGIE